MERYARAAIPNSLPLMYIPTEHDQTDWGYELDRLWSPYFTGENGSPRFWAATHLAPLPPHGNDMSLDVSNDVGLVHYILLPGETEWERLATSRNDVEAIAQQEIETLKKFKTVFTLSTYFKNVLESRGIKVAGVLKYPIITNYENAPPPPKSPRVVISQRFSEEKFPLIAMMVAELMPDVEFVFTRPDPLPLKYAGWLATAPRQNVKFELCPSKKELRKVIQESSCGFVVTGRDNFGVIGLEVLAQGRPFVAPKAFAFPEYVRPEFLYEPYCLKDIIKRIYRAIETGTAWAPWDLDESIQSLQAILSVY